LCGANVIDAVKRLVPEQIFFRDVDAHKSIMTQSPISANVEPSFKFKYKGGTCAHVLKTRGDLNAFPVHL
jgi:hypothetical protein